MSNGVVVHHWFEAAHRVPIHGGRCVNLHGHSWRCAIDVRTPHADDGRVVEFGAFKSGVRSWIDQHLDHATLLGVDDPLVKVLSLDGTRLFRFGADDPSAAELLAGDLRWPTSESLAEVIAAMAAAVLDSTPHALGARIWRVSVHQTSRKTAYWTDDE